MFITKLADLDIFFRHFPHKDTAYLCYQKIDNVAKYEWSLVPQLLTLLLLFANYQ